MEGLGDELVQPTLLLLQAGCHLTATLVPTAAGYPSPLGCSPLPPVHGPPQWDYHHNLFEATTINVQVNQCKLLLQHPSDLFQIKTSYLYDRNDIQLILHIPMALGDFILQLFQLHLFPQPFTKTRFLGCSPPIRSLLSLLAWTGCPLNYLW